MMDINIEEGKYYRTRDGRKVGPANLVEPQSDHPWNIPNETGPIFYYPDGTICLEYLEDAYNIVAEWKEEPLTKITTPFGLLTKEEQEALKAWPHGWEIFTYDGTWENRSDPLWILGNTYRAVPAPEEVIREMTVEEISEALGYPVRVVE